MRIMRVAISVVPAALALTPAPAMTATASQFSLTPLRNGRQRDRAEDNTSDRGEAFALKEASFPP
jgi:hypothetical protein